MIKYPITYEDLNPSDASNTIRGFNPTRTGIRVVKNGKRIELKDGRGDDTNVEFENKINFSWSDAKFSDDGRESY